MTPTWALVEDGRVRSLARTDTPPGDDWLPVDAIVPQYDPETHRPTGATFTIATDKVTATYAIVEILPPEPADEPEGDPQPQAVRERYRRQVVDAIADAIDLLDSLVAAPAVPEVPDGTLTTAQLSGAVRQMRDYVQQNRAGAQQVAATLKNTIRLVRGDFDTPVR